MASTPVLTTFKSATTVVTANFANSLFGGEYGTAFGSLLDPDDPRIVGHIHDGVKSDGHAAKVDLVDHVVSQLTNPNLGDKAVTKRTVFDTITVGDAIPEFTVSGVTTKYLLDLRGVRADIAFQEEASPSDAASAIVENKLIRQRNQTWSGSAYQDISGVWAGATGFDYVFGSSSLEDLASGTNGDSRFLFDKSKSAFRAGSAGGTQWDEANRGIGSIAFGVNVEASGDFSSISGGTENLVEDDFSVICGGTKNSIKSGSENSVIIGGSDNLIEVSSESVNPISYASVMGSRGRSHMWGQSTQASGAYDPADSVLTDFPDTVSTLGEWYAFTDRVGSAQAFEATMFGHFNYSRASIAADTVSYPAKTVAYLDGGTDSAFPKRVFIPRASCSYSIRIDATISYTYWDKNTLNVSSHNSVAFTMSGGVICRKDGTFDYKMLKLTETFDSGSIVVPSIGSSGNRVTNPAAPAGGGVSDFEVFFCHDEASPTDAGASIAKGTGLRMVMLNQSDAVGPNNDLVGESIAVKLTVVENKLNIYREPTV
jgi:hypothetical protein